MTLFAEVSPHTLHDASPVALEQCIADACRTRVAQHRLRDGSLKLRSSACSSLVRATQPPHQPQPHQQSHSGCYSLFGGNEYPLARVCQSLPMLIAAAGPHPTHAAALPPPPPVHTAPLKLPPGLLPPPGFENVIPQHKPAVHGLMIKEAVEEKKKSMEAASAALPSAVSSLSIALPSRSVSPTDSLAETASPTSSVGSSASSSAASSRKGSFSFAGSERNSPLLSAALPPLPPQSFGIRVLSPVAPAPATLPATANGRASHGRRGNGRRGQRARQ